MRPAEAAKPLAVVAAPPDENVAAINQIVIDLLEGLLVEARDGAIRGCAVAIVHSDGGTSDRLASVGGLLPAAMVGAIEIMSHRYAAELVERTGP